MKKNLLLIIFLFVVTGIYAQTYSVNDRVNIEWKGSWYTGKILAIKSNTYLVSYDGYSADWNEYVTVDRLKPIGNSIPTKDGVKIPTTATTSSVDTASIVSFTSVSTVNDLQTSTDGKYIYAVNGNIEIFNAKDLTLVNEIKVDKKSFTSISISHDGQYLAVGGYDNEFSIYKSSDEINFTEYFTSDVYTSIEKMRFSPTANELVVSGAPKENYKNTQADVWNVETKSLKLNLIKSTNANDVFSDVAYSNDGTKIALGISNANHGVEVYSSSTGKMTAKIKTPMDVVACAFSPDGNSIVAGGTDKGITLWSLVTNASIWKSAWNTEEDGYVYDVAFSSDGKTIAVCGKGSGKSVKIYDSISGKLKNEIGQSNSGGNAICYSTDLNFVFVALTTYGDIAKVPVVQRIKIPK